MWQILCNKGHDLPATNDWFQVSQSLGSLARKTQVVSKVNVESSGNNYIPRVLNIHVILCTLFPQTWILYTKRNVKYGCNIRKNNLTVTCLHSVQTWDRIHPHYSQYGSYKADMFFVNFVKLFCKDKLPD